MKINRSLKYMETFLPFKMKSEGADLLCHPDSHHWRWIRLDKIIQCNRTCVVETEISTVSKHTGLHHV
eukprot:8220297-Karenia_brevis.AAC.1